MAPTGSPTVKRAIRFEEPMSKVFFRQLMAGLSTMHTRGFAHRDISLENSLIHDSGALKISDFGVALPLVDQCPPSRERPGKFQYMSPEIYMGQVLNLVQQPICCCCCRCCCCDD